MNQVLLEILNGAWAIAAAALVVICVAYLWHEFRARREEITSLWPRKMMTRGMRVASAVGAIAVGSCIRATNVYIWRLGGGMSPDLGSTWLLLGTIIAVVGFLCAVRELSQALYGHRPWAITLAVIVIFAAIEVVTRI